MGTPVGWAAELLGLGDRCLGRLWAVDYRKPPDTSGYLGIVNPQVITDYASSCEVGFPSEISLLRQRFGVRVPGGAPPSPQLTPGVTPGLSFGRLARARIGPASGP